MRTRLLDAPLALVLALCLAPAAVHAAPDPGPGPTPGPTPGPQPPSPWPSVSLADNNRDYGMYASAAVGRYWCLSGGLLRLCSVIGIAHHDKTGGRLMYSSSTDGGATFSTVVVEQNEDGNIVGTHASLAFYGAMPVISYRDDTLGRLKFARRVGNGNGDCGTNEAWDCDSLGSGGLYSSLVVDGDGVAHIAHRGTNGLKLTESPAPFDDFESRDVSSHSVRAVKLVLDDLDRLHLAWATTTCVYYTYAFFEDIETVECSPANSSNDAGRISMDINMSEYPHLVYTLNTASGGYRVRYAYKTDYQTWAYSSVSLVTTPSPGTSLLLDTDDHDAQYIGWGTPSSGVRRLVLGYRAPIFGWDGFAADLTGGSFSNLLRLPNGKVLAVHYDPAAGDLRITRQP